MTVLLNEVVETLLQFSVIHKLFEAVADGSDSVIERAESLRLKRSPKLREFVFVIRGMF